MNPSPLTRRLFGAVLLLIGSATAFAQGVRDRAVEINAVAQETPRAIELQWNATEYTVTQQKIYRRLKDGPTWVELTPPANSATSYLDSTAGAGVSYEYRISRTISSGPVTAHGYVSAGIRAPLVVERGRVILLVDNTMAAPLAWELARFTEDLIGDGWTVVRQDVARAATPPNVRATIQAIYNADLAKTKALILFGHLPVPYSGDYAVDGHNPDHFGAWPTDVYYGDMNGTWTDVFINDSRAAQARNQNVPGDGKFDQTVIPSDVELQVGRIDLADLPAFNASETELLRRYLERNHQYRHQLGVFASIGRRGLVDDNFGNLPAEAFAVTAWRGFTACVGAGNVQALDWFTTLEVDSYLWAYGCGPGNFDSAGGVGSTADFATRNSRAVFNVTFGSYFGDWDATNSFLRAPLGERTPQGNETVASFGLVSAWSGRPHWVFHPMALGETVGYCARLTQNNTAATGYDSNFGERLNHIALLGDPTLRLYPVAPPWNFTATPTAQAVTLNWSAPADGPIEGYVIERATTPTGPFTRLRGALFTGTSYVDRSTIPDTAYSYMVRAVKLETSPTGTYLNPSQGVFSTPATAGAASGPEAEVKGNGNPIDAGDTAPLASNGTDFGSTEVSAVTTRTFLLSNFGAATLNLSGASISGANAGDFSIATAPPSTLAPGASASFAIQFHPSAVGSRVTTFTLASNDADESSYAFAIGGSGLPPHAEISIYPPAVNRSIHVGDAAVETLNISNPGPGELVHAITSSLARYRVRDSDSFAGPAYQWVDISGTGTEILATGTAPIRWANPDDATTPAIALGFKFSFYGNTFSSVRVSTNGFLSFTDPSASNATGALPNPSAPANLIAALWTDLILDADSHAYWRADGGEFIVQFENVSFFGNPGTRVTFEIILKPDGDILLQYKTITQLGSDYTVGIQNGSRDDGLLVSHDTAYAHSGLAVRIRPPGSESWLSLGATSGTVAPGGNQPIAATLNASGLALGNYYAELTVASNAAGNASVIIPVRLTVGNTPVEDWRLARFGTTANTGDAADTAHLDGDPRNNLLEYALVSEPLTTDTPGAPPVVKNAAGYLQMQFTRHTAHTDLRYFVEATSNLTGAWTLLASSIHGAPMIASGAHSCVETGGGDTKAVTVEDVAPTNDFSSRYLRLRVVRD